MGKYSLVITLGVMSVVSLIALQGQRMATDTQDRQSRREGQVIARQIARSGYNAVLSEARAVTDPDDDVNSIVSDVGTIKGSYEGGNYRAWLEKISPTAYKAVSEGKKIVADRVVKHKLGDNYADNNMVKVPTVDEPTVLKAEFEQSMAGYCSAIYLQRVQPDTKPKNQPEPEMVFPPGNNRNGASATFEKVIQPGTKLNFILAVDADYHCEERGDTTVTVDSDFYEYTRESFSQDESDFEEMKEKPYTMIEETSAGYRVAFEDLIFEEKQLWDIKQNGYPESTNWNSKEETYGGDGWDKNDDGLRDLEDYGSLPDFSDQVLQTTLESPTEDEAEDGEVADG
jgi:hypothetical protein